jgi:uncharacterized protein
LVFILKLWLSIIVLLSSILLQAKEQATVNLSTGHVYGVYYPIGMVICAQLNQSKVTVEGVDITCDTKPSAGSAENLRLINIGDAEFAIVQADMQHAASVGDAPFRRAHTRLRSVMSLHKEYYLVMTHPDSNINSFDDLKGKRVNLGDSKSGQRSTTNRLLKALGWNLLEFAQASSLGAYEQVKALCDGRIDAMFYTVGHQSKNINNAIQKCGAKILSIEGEAIEKFVKQHPWYQLTSIPSGTYQNHQQNISTFSLNASLVSNSDVDDAVVYALVKAIFENLDAVKYQHPALRNLMSAEMSEPQFGAPLHKGASKYYQEMGWID